MKIFLCSVVLVSSLGAAAAIPSANSKMQSHLELAQEILSMPEANRKIMAAEKKIEIYPALIKLSNSTDQSMETRWKALTLAAFVGGAKALKDIEGHLKSPEWFMRNAALVSLQSYFPAKARSAAQELLKDRALVVRSAAVDVLAIRLDPKAREILWEELSAKHNYRKKQSLWIRGQILSQLAKTPLEKERSLFLKALGESEPSLHPSAVAALEKITQKNIGKAEQNISKKRSLWLQWAKANPEFKVN